ncbi:hypothetical protein [Cecembia lonarensis]|uniref:Uncharacterized protein n=1 Tax=Cecembia lonarensis (strain CCUG 58316 / KCTC 22772 / LW9) TaxID=1225176 RepID=K1KXY2_CECL9|nr:hypothetical protein [Cecembia lonarensis]EKB48995.1 hypothetical protein B879_02412 [Cecembia lonarensis LW9]
MIIKSIHGTFSICSSGKDADKLLVKSKDKESLTRIFDGQRIVQSEAEEESFFVSLCKQEFAHILILMVKEINYPDIQSVFVGSNSKSDEVLV